LSENYSYRPNIFFKERRVWLEPNSIGYSRGNKASYIKFDDISQVLFLGVAARGSVTAHKKIIWRLYVQTVTGKKFVMSPLHYNPSCGWEDRSPQYSGFVRDFLRELRRHNPELEVVRRRHWTIRFPRSVKYKLAKPAGYLAYWIFSILRHFEIDRTIQAATFLAQLIGPRLRSHVVARANLTAAFPKKSPSEIDQILQGMWRNLGRVIGECIFLERLWDFQKTDTGRIVIGPDTLARAARLRARNQPVLFFGAHIANWEILGAASTALGLNSAGVYRPADLGRAWTLITEIRTRMMGTLIRAESGAAIKLRQALKSGKSIGMLVDQHFSGGVEVMFFGRLCKANPTIGRFARFTGCEIYGVRVTRLPANRYCIELTEPLTPARDAHGEIDVATTMQKITWVIESWIREHPEQWLWFHRRWG
jgi:KDO2-lipid IV(A) lauroyltransferase